MLTIPIYPQPETGTKAQAQSAMGLLLEVMRSAVGGLLEQSVEWGRIEAAHQERKTAMRTNKVRGTAVNPLVIYIFPSTSSAQLREGGGVCTYDGMIAHAGGLLSEKKSSMTSRKAMEAENKAKPAV